MQDSVVVNRDGLREMGIPLRRQQLRRLTMRGAFPAPIYLGHRTPVWVKSEVEDWLAARADARKEAA